MCPHGTELANSCKLCLKGYFDKYRESHRQEIKDRYLLKTYGLPLGGYRELLLKQGGCCAICKKPESVNIDKRTGKPKSLAVDHEHVPGFEQMPPEEKFLYIRGLLCMICNQTIGRLGDDPALFRAMADYLEGP